MRKSIRPADVDADLSWVRDRLGRTNPVPSSIALGPPGPGLVAAMAEAQPSAGAGPGRLRRRATVMTALIGAAALVAAVVAASVVGGGGRGRGVAVTASGQRAILAAAATTESAQSADASLTVSVGGTSYVVQGAADLTTGAANFTADLPAPIGSVEVLAAGGVAYLRVPAAFEALAGGKPWVKTDLSMVQGAFGHEAAVPGLRNGFDFTGFLDWLRGVSGQVTTVSTTETVHGAATTHYRATVDLAKAAATAPAAVRSRLQQAASTAGQTVPVDVWIDAQGRLRRLQVSFDRAESPGPVVATLELWGFGTAVDVTPPPADQVTDLNGMLGSLKNLTGGT